MTEDGLILLGLLLTAAGHVSSRTCDHCRHGDHGTCDRWFRDVCQCPHPTEETN